MENEEALLDSAHDDHIAWEERVDTPCPVEAGFVTLGENVEERDLGESTVRDILQI